MRLTVSAVLTCALLVVGSAGAQTGIKITAGTVIVESPDAPAPVLSNS
jgi:hypothetical protein